MGNYNHDLSLYIGTLCVYVCVCVVRIFKIYSLSTFQIYYAMWATWIRSLGQEDLLEKGMATPSSILSWKIPWTDEPGGSQSMGSQRAGHD